MCSKGHLSQWLCLQKDLVHILHFSSGICAKGKGLVVRPICREESALSNLILVYIEYRTSTQSSTYTSNTVIQYWSMGRCLWQAPVYSLPCTHRLFQLQYFKERMKCKWAQIYILAFLHTQKNKITPVCISLLPIFQFQSLICSVHSHFGT